jgi:chromosome segregation ATPase
MISGSEALGSIDEALQQVRRHMNELDEQIKSSGAELAHIGEEEVRAYQRLAAIRLDELTKGDVISRLDETDRRVGELLAMRAERLEQLRKQLVASHDKQSALESKRQAEREKCAKVTEELDRAEAHTQERLRHHAAHQSQLEKARQADAIAKQAEGKMQQAEQDLVEKGQPYQSDRLFMYLWQRGYGTSNYSANPLTRFLDGWVARLIRYHDARPNYSMLLEIPARLREHAQGVRSIAEKEFAALKSIEEAAAKEDGIPAIHEVLTRVEKQIEEIDAAIKAEEVHFSDLSKQQAAFGAGEDELYRQCLTLLVDDVRRDGIVELQQRAMESPAAEDNVTAKRLAEFARHRHELEEALRGFHDRHQRQLSRLQELEEVRHKFKDRRFDGANSTFSNGAMIGAVLGEFLRGMATSPELWGTILRQQRPRWTQSDPDFGSGGFPGGVWRTPIPGPVSFPSGGGGGGWGGGGGGIGEGGFRTGGGF